jgi:DNA segregation ATPase FtsK/SpoIIIE-like protein
VVVPPVLSNVTTRIALRTQSPEDSQTIIDRQEAANIPKALPGRALARSESTLLVEFQAAHGGAAYVPENRMSPVSLTAFEV